MERFGLSDIQAQAILDMRLARLQGLEREKIENEYACLLYTSGTTEVILRLMEGEFIKYKEIIPKNNDINVIIGKSILLESIERASLLAKEGKNNLIKMTIKNNLLTITSRSEEGNVKEEIIMEKTGDDLEIGFNSKFIIDVLKAIEDVYKRQALYDEHY